MVFLKVSAPGKVIFHGEHSVVYGYKAIACALNLRCHVNLSTDNLLNSSDIISLHIPNISTQSFCFTKEHYISLQTFLNLASSVQDKIQLVKQFIETQYFGNDEMCSKICSALTSCVYLIMSIVTEFHYASIVIDSDIPIGAGLGSSAAFSVSVAASLLIWSKELSADANCWSIEDRHTISKWAFNSEKIMHGTPSGVDNSTSTFGGAVVFCKGTELSLMSEFPQLEIILVNSGIPRSTSALVAGVKLRRSNNPEKYNQLFQEIQFIVEEALELFLSEVDADVLHKLGTLIKRNQEILEKIEVSHERLSEICSVLSRYGCTAKLTGAGGGGCAFGLIDSGFGNCCEDNNARSRMVSELKSLGFQVSLTQLGAPGVRID